MPKNLVFAVLAGVPFGVAIAALVMMTPPSVPLLIGCATVGLIMVTGLGIAAATRVKEEADLLPQG